MKNINLFLTNNLPNQNKCKLIDHPLFRVVDTLIFQMQNKGSNRLKYRV